MILYKIFAIFLIIKLSEALRCLTDDDSLDAEEKRVIRICMRKFGVNNYQLQGRYNNNNNNNHNSRSPNQRTNKNAYGNFPDYNHDNNTADLACFAHCFFEELQMLDNNNYPDRHKVLFVTMRDIRDRELRNFYTDTIQKCFRYLETHGRRDKCQFSRDLISCMWQYSKANCDDWNMVVN